MIELLKFAICDENTKFCSGLEKDIYEYAVQQGWKVNVSIFYSGETLLQEIKTGEGFDVILLNVELPGQNGIHIGNYIREDLVDDYTQLVYISDKVRYAMQLFDTRPMNFMLKPYELTKLHQILLTSYRLQKKQKEFFTYMVGHTIHRVPYRNILYFECVEKKLRIVMDDGEEFFYGKMKMLDHILDTSDFISIHKSYVINCAHTRTFEYHQVTMSNADVLPISQSNRSKVRKYTLKFLKEHN